MSNKSPKNRFNAQITFAMPLGSLGSSFTITAMTIDELKNGIKFYTNQSKSECHVKIQENMKTYPEFEWVTVEEYDDNSDLSALINWAELSRLLSGDRSVVTKNRMPKKHEQSVENLLIAIKKWNEERKNE